MSGATLGTADATALDAAVAAVPVIAVVRHDDVAVAEQIAAAAIAGGIRIVEITFTVPDAVGAIARLRAAHPDIVIGAGTVLDSGQLDEVADVGAAFAVSPVFDESVAARASERGVPYIPGAFTPTEIARAARVSAAVKVFPASALGPSFVSGVHDVLPGVRLMPTGGIGADDIGTWLAAGAYAVGIAGALGSAWRRGGAADVQTTAQIAVAAATAERSTS